MKKFPILLLSVTVLFAACGNNNNSKESSENKKDTTIQAVNNPAEPKKTASVNDIVSRYLQIKNALTSDNGNEAAAAANDVHTVLENLDSSVLTPQQKQVYDEVKDDIKEHAEHIAANASNIAHQREHFDLLSQDMIDLVKAIGSAQTLYRDFCPMYNDKKGASWLSETKETKNPYYGKEMPTCGEVKEEIKAKG